MSMTDIKYYGLSAINYLWLTASAVIVANSADGYSAMGYTVVAALTAYMAFGAVTVYYEWKHMYAICAVLPMKQIIKAKWAFYLAPVVAGVLAMYLVVASAAATAIALYVCITAVLTAHALFVYMLTKAR